jgi:ABC-type polar amino acid transport system ATPase subunit
MEALRVEGLRKSFGAHEVLRGVDLSVAAHEVVCLIGASGSGKSTLLRCVNLLERIDAGTIWTASRSPVRAWTRTWSGGTSASCSSRSTCSRT